MLLLSFIGPLLIAGYVSGTDCPDGWLAYHHSCYYFARNNATSFANAQDFCKRLGEGVLIQVETSEENAFIKNYLSGLRTADYWMGLRDHVAEGVFRWENSGEQLQYTNWRHGAPNNHHDQDCVKFDHSAAYQWDDADCSKAFEPICELERSVPGVSVVVG